MEKEKVNVTEELREVNVNGMYNPVEDNLDVKEFVDKKAVDFSKVLDNANNGKIELPFVLNRLENRYRDSKGEILTYHDYYIDIELRGFKKRINFCPALPRKFDKRTKAQSYENMDMVFAGSQTAKLMAKSMYSNFNGLERYYYDYFAFDIDDLGVEYSCPISALTASDESMMMSAIATYLKRLEIKEKLSENKEEK